MKRGNMGEKRERQKERRNMGKDVKYVVQKKEIPKCGREENKGWARIRI